MVLGQGRLKTARQTLVCLMLMMSMFINVKYLWRLLRAMIFLVSLFMVETKGFAASSYSTAANNAAQWLSGQQNYDGSWGASDSLKVLYTSEAVLALQALGQRNSSYFWGIAWLENHDAPNVDYKARRILALASHNDDLSSELAAIEAWQQIAVPGNSTWGLSDQYQGGPLDTALALQALSQLGVSTNTAAALTQLKTVQLTGANDKGWPLAQESISDPATTAEVVLALSLYKATDATLVTPIANAVSTLVSQVTTTSPNYLQALASLALTKSGVQSVTNTLLPSLVANQSSANGSWDQDIYATALAIRAFGAAQQTDTAALASIVSIPDLGLRAAINLQLKRNRLDALTQGDLLQLTALNAAGFAISDLTGLSYATNLQSIDLSNNQLTSLAPISRLPFDPVVTWAGNPGYQALPPVLSLDSVGTPMVPPAGGISATDPCGIAGSVGCQSLDGLSADGWADGTIVQTNHITASTATFTQELLGSLSRLQPGVSFNQGMLQFSLNSTQTQATITVTENTAASATDFMDPAISVYAGILPSQALDNTTTDPLVPDCTLAGECSPRNSMFQQGRLALKTATATNYVGQFNPWGNFSVANSLGAGGLLTYLSSVSGRTCPAAITANPAVSTVTSAGPATAAPQQGPVVCQVGNHGLSETITLTGLTPNSTYTVIVGGERCRSVPPYATTYNNEVCAAGGAFVNTSRFYATVTITKQ